MSLGRRGVVASMLWKMAVFVVGAILFILIFTFFEDFLTSQTDYASVNNAKQLVKTAAAMVESGEPVAFATMPVYVSEDYALVGFGKRQREVFQIYTDEYIAKPNIPACQGSCICGYKGEDIEFCLAVPVDYISSIDYGNYDGFARRPRYISNDDKNWWAIVSGFSGDSFSMSRDKMYLPASFFAEVPPKYEFSSFAIYGNCCATVLESDSPKDAEQKDFGVQYLTLEVLHAEDNAYLTIYYKNTLDLEQRQRALLEIFKEDAALP